MEIKDIAEYEETDSELAKYTISDLHYRINKAIEYIEMYDKKGNDLVFSMKASDDLIDILKGSE